MEEDKSKDEYLIDTKDKVDSAISSAVLEALRGLETANVLSTDTEERHQEQNDVDHASDENKENTHDDVHNNDNQNIDSQLIERATRDILDKTSEQETQHEEHIEEDADKAHSDDNDSSEKPVSVGEEQEVDNKDTEKEKSRASVLGELNQSTRETIERILKEREEPRLQQNSKGLKFVSNSQAQLAALPLILTAPNYLPLEIQLSINSLPILDNLATQILRIFVSSTYEQVLALTQVPEDEYDLSPDAENFKALVEIFSFAKNIYTRKQKDFISIEDVAPGIWTPNDPISDYITGREEIFENTLRKANLATFLCGVTNSIETGFSALNENFLDVFCPGELIFTAFRERNISSNGDKAIGNPLANYGPSGKLQYSQARLFLELKTQAYIAALADFGTKELAQADLDDLFPDNLTEIFTARHSYSKLTEVETEFVTRCSNRKNMLKACESAEELSEQYVFDEFIERLLEYLNTNLGMIIYGNRFNIKSLRTSVPSNTLWSQTINDHMSALEKLSLPPLNKGIISSSKQEISSDLNLNNKRDTMIDKKDNRKHDQTDDNVDRNEADDIQMEDLDTDLVQEHLSFIKRRKKEKPLNRNFWTEEEESALVHGLMMKGAKWKAILSLFGPGGSISEALKNRNPLQLKDKARNWKMGYLREGKTVPEYLKGVTGDLSGKSNGRGLGLRRLKMREAKGVQ